jgi:hypothetical protein
VKLGYHVVVSVCGLGDPHFYAVMIPRTENQRDCFDREWQSVGFFETEMEAAHFADEMTKLVGI